MRQSRWPWAKMTNDKIQMTNKAPNPNYQNNILISDLRNWDLPHTNPSLCSRWYGASINNGLLVGISYTCPVLKFEEFVVPGIENWSLRFGISKKVMIEEKKENLARSSTHLAQADGEQASRPPVVVVLGHVDHGKSSILEAFKKSVRITEKEAGGITQHIGAYEIEHSSAGLGQMKKITFIDTPGHEAFSAIRSRGAKVADLAVLVVAADDGVKNQTKEAISHIKKAGIPFIVALNKTDKPEADPERVMRELSQQEVLVERLGGKVPSVKVSAKTGQKMEELLDLILLVAEMEELKGNIHKPAEGVVIEAYLDNLRGPTATLLVGDGVLKTGNIVGTDSAVGKIKILENFQGESINKAFPSMPVVALGFDKVPRIGEKFKIFPDLKTAQNNTKKDISEKREGAQVFVSESSKKILSLILKTDVLGSLEAIEELLKDIPQKKVAVRILKGEVGEINETDLKLAMSAKAKVLGFRVKTNPRAEAFSEKEKIKIMNFEIIYELSKWVRQTMEKIVEPEIIKKELGKMKILVVFQGEKSKQVIGGRVLKGKIKKGSVIDVSRNEEIIGKGKLVNLQKDKRDVDECEVRDECGILYEGSGKIEEGDILVFYKVERIRGKL
ncbi:translation initiation factor IF-2 [Patescibacteria group bacterium]|nr:translation initiation factor IF-2 [Patescibacteria group bacterium]